MDQTNQFPSCGAYFFRVNSSSSGLIEQGEFDVTCQQQSNFRDMTVQAVDSFPILNNQSEIFQNGSELFNLFNQYPLACSSSEINYDLPDFTPEELDMCLGPNETSSDELSYTELNAQTDISSPLQGKSCLIEQGQFDVDCKQSNFRGMTVQAVDSFPDLNNQSEIFQNGPELFNPFDQYLACSSSEINYDLPDFTPEKIDTYLDPNETSSDELRYTELNAQTDISSPLQGKSCLIEQGQFDVDCKQSNFRGMTVQAVESFPILNNQSEILQNEPSNFQGLTVQAVDSFPDLNNQSEIFQNGPELFNPFDQYLACSSSEINYDLPDFTPEKIDTYLDPNETSSDELRYTELNAPTDISSPLQGKSCLIEQGQFDVDCKQSNFRGMTVQAVESFPILNNQSEILQNEPSNFQGLTVQAVDSFPDLNNQSEIFQNGPELFNPFDQYLACSSSEINYDLPDFTPEKIDTYLDPNETSSDELRYTELNAPTDTSPPLQAASCGETSVNFSQSSSRPVVIISPLNTVIQQQVQIETEGTVSINSGNTVKSLKRPLSECKDSEATPQKSAKNRSPTISENSFGTSGFEIIEPSASSESVSLTSGDNFRKVYQKAYLKAFWDKLKELVPAAIFNLAKAAGQAAGKGAGKDYPKAYQKAYRDKLKELVIQDIFDQAKAAGKAAGNAAKDRAKELSASGSGELPPPPLFSRQTEGDERSALRLTKSDQSSERTDSADSQIIRPQSNDNRPYVCEFEKCGKTFKRISHLKVHHFVHKPISDYKCSYPGCDDSKCFRDKTQLDRHIRSIHTKEKPYSCELCDKSFTRFDHVKKHMITHTHQKAQFRLCVVKPSGSIFDLKNLQLRTCESLDIASSPGIAVNTLSRPL